MGIDFAAALRECNHRAKDELMRADVEVFGLEKFDGEIDETIIEDD